MRPTRMEIRNALSLLDPGIWVDCNRCGEPFEVANRRQIKDDRHMCGRCVMELMMREPAFN